MIAQPQFSMYRTANMEQSSLPHFVKRTKECKSPEQRPVPKAFQADHRRLLIKDEQIILTGARGCPLLEEAYSMVSSKYFDRGIMQLAAVRAETKRPQHRTLLHNNEKLIITGKAGSSFVEEVYEWLRDKLRQRDADYTSETCTGLSKRLLLLNMEKRNTTYISQVPAVHLTIDDIAKAVDDSSFKTKIANKFERVPCPPYTPDIADRADVEDSANNVGAILEDTYIRYQREELLDLSTRDICSVYPHYLIIGDCEILLHPMDDSNIPAHESCAMDQANESISSPVPDFKSPYYTTPYAKTSYSTAPYRNSSAAVTDPRSWGDTTSTKHFPKPRNKLGKFHLTGENCGAFYDNNVTEADVVREFGTESKCIPSAVAFTNRPRESRDSQSIQELLELYESNPHMSSTQK